MLDVEFKMEVVTCEDKFCFCMFFNEEEQDEKHRTFYF